MYSQNSEEKIILDYFAGKIGTFCDVGSNNGVTLSNVRALAELGWSGVFVEPSPIAFQQLKKNYEVFPKGKLFFYPFALGVTNGMVKMQDSGEHLGKGDHGLLSTLSDADYNKWRGTTEYKEIEVQCFRWKTFMNRVSIKSFDFISIDAEGFDLAILKQIDLRETKLLCIEWNGVVETKEAFDKLMIGFNLIHHNQENLIYGR